MDELTTWLLLRMLIVALWDAYMEASKTWLADVQVPMPVKFD
jgi:hypothetical protein